MRFWHGLASIVADGIARTGRVCSRLISDLSKRPLAARWAIGALAACGVAALLIGMLTGTPSASRAPGEPGEIAGISKPIVPSPELSAALENSLRAIEDGERTSPRDRWDPRFVVQQVGSDPEVLFRWVRDNTTWIPYHGTLRGPVGVLMDRRGNSLDRAVLLGTLLREAGHTVRLAHGEIPHDREAAVLASLLRPVERPSARRSATDPVEVGSLAAGYKLDGAAIDEAIRLETEAREDAGVDLAKRRDDQVGRLAAAIDTKRGNTGASAEFYQRLDAAGAAVRDHWWVQRQDGANWVDLDVAVPDATPALAAASDLKALDELTDLRHTLTVRVIAERWSGQSLSEHKALDHVFAPSEHIGKPIVLQFFPVNWPMPSADTGALSQDAMRTTALAQDEWRATLSAGRDTIAHATISAAGGVESNKAPSPLGGLGGALSNAVGDSSRKTPTGDQLTAVWIEYETRFRSRLQTRSTWCFAR